MKTSDMAAALHDRMPLILAPGDYERWFSGDPDPADLIRPTGRRNDHVVGEQAREEVG